jgi:hypothetical protein
MTQLGRLFDSMASKEAAVATDAYRVLSNIISTRVLAAPSIAAR